MINLKRFFAPLWGPLLMGLCLSCAAKTALVVPRQVVPVPGVLIREQPAAAASFDRMEAGDINHVTLLFLLDVQNPRSSAAGLEIQDWKAAINGLNTGESAALGIGGNIARVDAGSSLQIPLRLTVDLNKLPLEQEDFDEYQADLNFNLEFTFDTRDTAEIAVAAKAAFPRIRKPDFNITAIAIMKAELINTRFKVNLRVDNPNFFPVELSSFSYELYGADRFWADGEKTDILLIPARGSAETELSLVMNFINMRRELLDQIIAMKQVNYRLAGEAEVSTNMEFLPHFLVNFDRSGNSVVID
ncbi:MAG: LEA type 2 family protein [Spirochaetaceae bacterium]|jgi:LEA14-like dessication related protein|nr:LEA type 2 family protein [Spirochaetaceae bacterium]